MSRSKGEQTAWIFSFRLQQLHSKNEHCSLVFSIWVLVTGWSNEKDIKSKNKVLSPYEPHDMISIMTKYCKSDLPVKICILVRDTVVFGYSKIIRKSVFWSIVGKLTCSPQMCAADIVAPLTINYFRHGGYRQAYP